MEEDQRVILKRRRELKRASSTRLSYAATKKERIEAAPFSYVSWPFCVAFELFLSIEPTSQPEVFLSLFPTQCSD